MCVRAYAHMCSCPWGPREGDGVRYCWSRSPRWIWATQHWPWSLPSGPLQWLCALLTHEPSLTEQWWGNWDRRGEPRWVQKEGTESWIQGPILIPNPSPTPLQGPQCVILQADKTPLPTSKTHPRRKGSSRPQEAPSWRHLNCRESEIFYWKHKISVPKLSWAGHCWPMGSGWILSQDEGRRGARWESWEGTCGEDWRDLGAGQCPSQASLDLVLTSSHSICLCHSCAQHQKVL